MPVFLVAIVLVGLVAGSYAEQRVAAAAIADMIRSYPRNCWHQASIAICKHGPDRVVVANVAFPRVDHAQADGLLKRTNPALL